MVIDSTHAYRPLWHFFRVLAPTFFGARSRAVYVYMALLHLLITALFPIHVGLGLLLPTTTRADLFKCLTITIMSISCSLKHYAQIWRLPDMLEIEGILSQLDKRVQSTAEHQYYRNTLQKQVNRLTGCIYSSYTFVYGLSVPVAILILLTDPPKLLYEAYVPFDWQTGGLPYYGIFIYQYICILVKAFVGLTNDIYTPLTLCNIAGHMHLFSIRMSHLGYRKIPENQTYQQLRLYFEDYRLLMRMVKLTRKIISPVQLVQILFCGISMCIIVSQMAFYEMDTTVLAFNVVLLAVVCVQIFPSCYFASVVTERMDQLPYAVFSSNWYEQSRRYRQNVVTFTQLTLRLTDDPFMAGGLIVINLDTFFATVKMAYSLFAVISQVKMN
ncbi:odorant receptor 33c [Drosophila mojavensis]|nr:odorant receptor 33c [Drosophila mojavensis]